MNLLKTVSVFRIIGLTLCIALLVTVALCGFPNFLFLGNDGVFEKDAVTLGLDLAGGSIITYEAVGLNGETVTDEGLRNVEEVMRKRLDNLGYTEALVYLFGGNCIRVEIPGISDPTKAAETIGSTAKLEFVDVDGAVIVTGDHVEAAYAQYGDPTNSGTEQYYVALRFDSVGAKLFADGTEAVSKRSADSKNYISINLDERSISTATVKESITGGSAVITGSFTYDEVQELATLINGGSLEYDLLCDDTHGSLSSVAASLGEKSLSTSLIAGGIGLILVMLFMILIYRLPGFISSLCLVAYTAIIAILLVVTKANLTLPGIAGIVLSIGMAVDANVVVFERIKEELRSGKTIAKSVEVGFNNALSAVIDSNITTVIAAVVLWWLGSGSIQGFAVTLFMGVCVSMVTSVWLTKKYLKRFVDCGLHSTGLFGVKRNGGVQ